MFDQFISLILCSTPKHQFPEISVDQEKFHCLKNYQIHKKQSTQKYRMDPVHKRGE